MPYAILCAVIIFQISLVLFIILFLKNNYKSGVGYLYGPLFFLAVNKLLSLSLVKPYVPLEILISGYHSILFLDLSIFGEIPWCFFPNINHILNYFLRLVGSLITFGVVLAIVFSTRRFSRTFSKFLSSPVQTIRLLIILSFWSISNTCIEIMKPVIMKYGWRVAIEPELEYLGNKYHILLWSLSVILMLLLYTPFIFLLLFSQCLRSKVNLFHIQPLLDAFQSSFKDKHQWYSGVYLVVSVILNINVPTYVFKSILTFVCVLHFLVHPHKNRWLNRSDTLLLADLILLTFLTFQNENSQQSTPSYMIYTFVIIPLLYILIGGAWFTFGNFLMNILKKKCMETELNMLTSDLVPTLDSEDRNVHNGVKSVEVDLSREPLIFDDS